MGHGRGAFGNRHGAWQLGEMRAWPWGIFGNVCSIGATLEIHDRIVRLPGKNTVSVKFVYDANLKVARSHKKAERFVLHSRNT